VKPVEVRIPESVFEHDSVQRFSGLLEQRGIPKPRVRGIVAAILTERIGAIADRYVATMRAHVIEILRIRNDLRARYAELNEHFRLGRSALELPDRLKPEAFDGLFSDLGHAFERLQEPKEFMAGRMPEVVNAGVTPGELANAMHGDPAHPAVPDEPPPGYPVEAPPRPRSIPRRTGPRRRIANRDDLQKAIREVGPPGTKGKLAAKEHIVERAKELGHIRDVPEDWRIEVEEAQEHLEDPRVSREERAERAYYNDLNRRAGPDPSREFLDEAMHDLLLRDDAEYLLPPDWNVKIVKSPEYGARVAQQAAFAERDPLFAAHGYELEFSAGNGMVFKPDATEFRSDLSLEFFEFKDPMETGSVETYRSRPDLELELRDTMIRRAEAAQSLGAKCRGWTYDTSLPEMNEYLFDVLDQALPDSSPLRRLIRIADPKGRTL
jgi:hypothetical protein